MSYFNTLAFGVYPYVAMIILLVGSWMRYDREQYSWKASSSQLLEKKQLRMGSILFHVGVLGIFFGHFFGLLTPVELWHVLGVTAPMKQMVAMGAGGLFGLICFAGLTILIKRRLGNPRVRATSKKMDIVILFLLYAQLLLGLFSILVSASHLDGAEMMALMMWAQNIMTLDLAEAVQNIAHVHWIYKAHVVLGMTLFVVFPFSRLVHMFSAPVQYVTRQHQIVRKRFAR
ncbi:respiratory nitrate reductase subunit gamma [Thalassolituus sp. LLYu03]|uniref:respiratory nitrate reductase subunit gamma n=1 Tax=Thalassolituus sp. LLYu03 TaxID=3421656 RepID=UPI003D2DEA9E